MPAPRNDLPFQYQMRGQQLQYLSGDEEAHAIDQRDRDLEDYLGRLTAAGKPNPANALGVIAKGTFAVTDGQGWTATGVLTNPMSFKGLAGRRYRIYCNVRATTSVANNQWYLALRQDGVYAGDRYSQVIGSLGYVQSWASWLLDGDGLTHAWTISVEGGFGAGTVLGYPAEFYAEDMGPIGGVGPPVPIPDSGTPWVTPVMQNGWHHIGGLWSPPGFRKLGDLVFIRGVISNPTAMTPTQSSTVFTLPVGFRPAVDCILTGSSSGSSGYGDGQTRIQINANGTVQVVCGNPSTQGQAGYTSLDGLSAATT